MTMQRHPQKHRGYTVIAIPNANVNAPTSRRWTVRIEDARGDRVRIRYPIGGRTRAQAWQAGIRYVEQELADP